MHFLSTFRYIVSFLSACSFPLSFSAIGFRPSRFACFVFLLATFPLALSPFSFRSARPRYYRPMCAGYPCSWLCYPCSWLSERLRYRLALSFLFSARASARPASASALARPAFFALKYPISPLLRCKMPFLGVKIGVN